MMIQIRILRNLQLVAGLFLAIVSGCVKGQQPPNAATYQSIDEYTVRVLLDDKVTNASLRMDGPYKIINVDTTEVFPIQTTGETLNIELQPDGIKAGFQLFKTKRLIIEPQRPMPLKINNQSYRGSIEFKINDDSNTPNMMIINNVSLESYLMGVVAAEMPSYWDAEALKAQAIASRTYCLYIKSKFGKNRSWDVKATQANQVYKGVSAETLRTTNAVAATTGMVLCCGNEYGDCVPFGAYYSSVCGGHTENAQDVFGESSPALIGVDCPYCRQITRPDIFYWPMAKFDKKYVSQQLISRYPSLKELGKIEKIEVERENIYDSTVLSNGLLPQTSAFKRIVSVRLTGSPQTSSAATRKYIEPNSPQAAGKTMLLRAEDMRLAIDPTGTKIQSMCCTILNTQNEIIFVNGIGFGHGVGLCQYGARQMARDGKTAEQILGYYYPNSRIKILY
ncbi:MAG: SpoIID/LytB domain-containing protein [Sedimentisphaerales bacterium]